MPASFRLPVPLRRPATLLLAAAAGAALGPAMAKADTAPAPPAFRLEEATVAQIDAALASGQLTSVKLVQMYLDRIAAEMPPTVAIGTPARASTNGTATLV